ncbi:hypothetical protein [Mycolicibacterium aichiense]|uniref:Bacteriophage protein n=1 Tax=Mycolicibacterium aichiense TaxID=1799 RepID=A0AAD1HM60_9MYCO|nr:hypothetical protein [Mycolicibacterium aichiense]MCV7017636.1 hypothetical protein [Mycolicibacterium aichiense]BBX06758.1 bacteriophage protein [Mycolicibacterium aichiense]STZ80576.1 Bacteriophage protein [Mycolicibacterium aichiense]
MTEPSDPTELAGLAAMHTEAAQAWSSAGDYPETGSWADPERRLTPRLITTLAVAASLALVAAAGTAVWVLRNDRAQTSNVDAPAPPVSNVAGPAPAAIPAPPSALPPPPTPAVVMLSTRGGDVWVGTQSKKTVCQITAGRVGCLVKFVIDTPMMYGAPANGVNVTTTGDFEWGIGDIGQQPFKTLSYGTIYKAFGWTITPTSDGTTFLNDATSHGMTVSIEGVQPF